MGSKHHTLNSANTGTDIYIYIYIYKVKVLGLAYNQRETRDKRPLGRDPDRKELVSPPYWCKAFLVAAHGSMDIGGSIGQGEKFSA